MTLTERNCPILKYLRWNDELFRHPDFRETLVPLNSDFGKSCSENAAERGLRVTKIYNMTRLGRHCFLRPYTTEYSREIIERSIRTGNRLSDMLDFYVALEPVTENDAERQRENEDDDTENVSDNTTDYSDCVMAFNKQWKTLVQQFSKNIDIVSANFWEAMNRTFKTFMTENILSFLVGEHISGTIIVPTQKGLAFMYDLQINKIYPSDGELLVDYDGVILHLHDYSRVKFITADDYQFVDQSYLFSGKNKDNVAGHAISEILLYELFKRYADIETRNVSKLTQHNDHIEVKTFTKNVNYIDCTWFTTIIRTEGFNVRGHFRLQPCGEGNLHRKLIYINEFQKHGYTRKAKLLKQDEP